MVMLGSASLGRSLAGALGAGAVLAAVAGCSSGGSSSGPASSASSSSSAVSSPSSSAPSSSAPAAPASSASSGSQSPHAVAGSSSAQSVPAGCATRALQAALGISQGAAGSVYQIIDFTNIGNATCTMYGYPGVSLAAGTPVTQVGKAATRSTVAAPALVTLSPGQTANALLRVVQALNFPAATCSPTATTYLQIYPPNQTTPIYLAYKSTGCTSNSVNLLTIGIVQAGAGSQ